MGMEKKARGKKKKNNKKQIKTTNNKRTKLHLFIFFIVFVPGFSRETRVCRGNPENSSCASVVMFCCRGLPGFAGVFGETGVCRGNPETNSCASVVTKKIYCFFLPGFSGENKNSKKK